VDEQPEKPKRGRPKRTRKCRPETARQFVKEIAILTGDPLRQLSERYGIPVSTLGQWKVRDNWDAARAEARKLADRKGLETAVQVMAHQRMALSESQRQLEEVACAGARAAERPLLSLISIISTQVEEARGLTAQQQKAWFANHGEALLKNLHQAISAQDRNNLFWRRNDGLPEHGKDYADHELLQIGHALVNAVIPAILEAIPDSATSARVIEIVERIDWHRVIETRGKLGPAAQPVARDEKLVAPDGAGEQADE
jgi:hypothetical protein